MSDATKSRIVLAAMVTIPLLLVCILAAIVFKVNPQADSNRREIATQQQTLHSIICAQAQSTANAFRFRQVGPDGKVEGVRHFATRMQAQYETLRLSRKIGCKSAPGFPPFDAQLRRALRQIRRILANLSARQTRPTNTATEAVPSPGSIVTAPGALGVGDNGEQRGGAIGPQHSVEAEETRKGKPPFQVPRVTEPPPVEQARPAGPVEAPAPEPPPPIEAGAVEAGPVHAEASLTVPLCTVVRELADLC